MMERLEDRLAPATVSWTGAVSNLWSVAGNWVGGVPASNDTLVFDPTTAGFSTTNGFNPDDDLTGTNALTGLTLTIKETAASSNFDFTCATGGGIGLGTTGIICTVNSANSVTEAIPLTLTGPGATTISVTGGPLNVTAQVFGIGGLTTTGTGVLALDVSNNSYQGPVTVNSNSTLVAGANAALGYGMASVTVSGALELNNVDYTTVQNVTCNANAFFAAMGGGASTFVGAFTSSSGFDISAEGATTSLTLTGGITYTGNGGGDSFNYDTTATGTIIENTTGINGGQDAVYNGFLDVNVANPNLGEFNIGSNATLKVTVNQGLGNNYNPVTMQGPGDPTLIFDGSTSVSNQLNYSAPTRIQVSSPTANIESINGDNTYAGSITASNGFPVDITSATLGDTFSLTGTFNLNGGTAEFTGPGTTYVPINLADPGAVTVDGPGTAILAGTDSYTGPTTANGGNLQITGSLTASAITCTASGTVSGNGTVQGMSVSGNLYPGLGSTVGTLTAQGNTLFSGNQAIFTAQLDGTGTLGSSNQLLETNNGSVNLGTHTTLAVNVTTPTVPEQVFTIISAPGGITSTFAGLPNLATFMVGGHTYQINYNPVIGNTPATVTITDLGYLHWIGSSAANGNLWSVRTNWEEDAAPIHGSVVIFDTNTPGFSATPNGFDPVNDMNGVTLGGIIIHDASTAGDFNISGNPATLGLRTSTVIASAVTAGTIANVNLSLDLVETCTLQLGAGAPLDLSGALSGTSPINIVGPGGTLILSGASSGYTGAISVSKSTVEVNADYEGSAFTMTGGTLTGSGSVYSINATGATINPGGPANTGTIDCNGPVLSSLTGSTLDVNLNSTAGAGLLDFGFGGAVNLAGATLAVNVLNSAPGNTYTIISSVSGGILGNFTGLANNAAFIDEGRLFQINYTGTAVTLTDITPSTALHWIGSASANGNLWSVPSNWLEDIVPSSGDSLFFDTTTPGFVTTANSFVPVNNMTGLSNLAILINDNSASQAFDLTGNALSLAAGGIVSSVSTAANATVAMPLTLSGPTPVAVNPGMPLVLSGVISGAGGLSKIGIGSLTLAGNNSFTGAVSENAGTLVVAANNALGSGAAATTVASGAILQLANVDYTTAQPLTLVGGATLDTPSSGGPLILASRFAGPVTNQGTSAFPGIIDTGANSSLTLTGGIVNTALAAGLTINPSGTGALTIANTGISDPTGTVALTVDGGTLNLNVASTYNGVTTIEPAATVDVTVNGALGATNPGDMVALQGPGTATLIFDSGVNYSSFAVIDVVNGTGNIESQNGNSTFAGSIVANAALALTSNTAGDLFTLSGPITTNGNNLQFAGPGNVLLSTNLGGTGSVSLNGTGTVTLSGMDTYSGPTLVNKGTLTVTGDLTASSITATGNTLVTGTGFVQGLNTQGTLAPGLGGVGNLTVEDNTTFAYGSAVFEAQLNGTAGGSANQLVENSGGVNLGSSTTLALTVTTPTTTGETIPLITGAGSIVGTFVGLPNNATFVNSGRVYEINYSTSSVTLTDLGTPPTTLHWIGGASGNQWSVASNWLEDTVPTSGVTLVFDTTAPGFLASANGFNSVNNLTGLTNMTLTFNDASSAGSFSLTGNAIGLRSSAGIGITSTVSSGAGVTVADSLTLAANTTIVVGQGTLTLSGVIGDGGSSFSLTAAGSTGTTLALNNANTYHGGTVLDSGTLQVGNSSALGTGTITLAGGSLSDGSSFVNMTNPYTVVAPTTITGSSSFILAGPGVLDAALTLTNTNFLTLNGALSGPGGLIENGSSTGLTILGGTLPNSFTGPTTVLTGGLTLQKTAGAQALATPITVLGTLTLGASDQLQGTSGTAITLAGGTLNLNGFTDSIASLGGNGTVNTGAGLSIVGGGTQVFTGAVQGTGSLTYDGTGSLALSGSNSAFTGQLYAAAGTLIVSGNFSAAPAQVSAGAILTGAGIVENITATGGTVNPGSTTSTGILSTVGGAFASTLNAAAFAVNLSNPTASDQLVIGDGASLNLTGSTLNVNVLGAVPGNVYTIVSSSTGGISGIFTGLANNATLTSGGQTFQITYSAHAVTLTDVGGTPNTLHWIGGTGANGNLWNVAANWLEDVVPVSGDSLVFDTTTAGFSATPSVFAPVNNMTGLANLTLTFNDASAVSDFDLTGNAIGLRGTAGIGIASTVSNGVGVTIGDNLTLAANTTIDIGLGTLILGGVIDDGGLSFSLTDASSPGTTLTLGAADTYHGGTVLDAGTLRVGTNTSLGTGMVTLAGGTLANAASSLNLSNPYTVSAPSAIGGTNALTLSGNGVLDATLTLSNTSSLTLSGALSGPGGLTENGFPGSTTLSGSTANTFAGATNILSGNLVLQKTAGTSALPAPVTVSGTLSTLTLAAANQLVGTTAVTMAGGTFNMNGFSDRIASLGGTGTVNTGSGLTIVGSGAQVFTGSFQGSGPVTYSGSGSLGLFGPSAAFTGQLNAQSGTLVVSANFSSSPVQLAAGATLTGTGIVASINTTGGTLYPGGTGTYGILSTAAGALASSLTGATFEVDINSPTASDQLVVGNGATISLNGATPTFNILGSASGNVYTLVSSATGGIAGTFNGLPNDTTFISNGRYFEIAYSANAVTLTDQGGLPTTRHWLGSADAGGNLWNVASNWLEDLVPVNGNTLVFDSTTPGFSAVSNGFNPVNNVTGLTNVNVVINDASSAGAFDLTGDAIGLGSAGITSTVSMVSNATVALPLALPGATTFTVNPGSPLVISGALSGSGALTSAGLGTLNLDANNSSFSGSVYDNAGTLAVSVNNALGSGSATTTVAPAAVLLFNNVNYTTAQPVTLSAGATLTTSLTGGGSSFAGTVANLGTAANPGAIDVNNSLVLSGGIVSTAASAGLDFNPTGTGTLTLKTVGISDTAGPVTVTVGGGALDLNVASSYTGTTTINANATVDVTANGALGATGTGNNVILQGPGIATLIFDGGVNYASTKNIIINGGPANIQGQGGNDTFAGAIVDNNPTGFDLTSQTSGDLFTLSGAITTNGNLTQLFGPGNALLSSNLTGTGALSLNGTGTVTLSGNDSYTGATQVNSGTLSVTGSVTASGINETTSATVIGTGTVQGLTIAGNLLPGLAGAGTLTANGNTAFTSSSSTFSAQLNGTGAGSSNKLLETGGALINLGTQTTLAITQIVPTTKGETFTIISGASSITGTFLGLPNNSTIANAGRTYQITYTSSSVTLTDITPLAVHWIGGTGATGNLWNVASNWLENAVPVSGDALYFNTATPGFSATANGFNPVNNITGLTNLILYINDASPAGDFSLSGTAIGLAPLGVTSTVNPGVNATVALPLNLPGASTFTVNSGSPLLLSGTLTGAGALAFAGTGSLILSGNNNSFTGSINDNAGTLVVTTNNALGSGAGSTTVAGGAILQLNNVAYATPQPISLAPGAILNTVPVAGLGSSFAGVITSQGTSATPAVIDTNSPLTLTGGIVNTAASAGLNINPTGSGTLTLNTAGITDSAGTVAVTVGGGTLDLNTASTYTGSTTVKANATVDVTVNGGLGATGTGNNFILQGPGTPTLIFSGGLNYASAKNIVITGGPGTIESLGGNNAFGGTINANNDTGFTLTSGTSGDLFTLSGAISTNGNVTQFAGPGNFQVSNLGGTGSVSINGTGTVTFSGTDSFTGQTQVTSGTLAVTGSLPASVVTELAHATVIGTGTVQSPNFSGNLTPGLGGIGTFTANGNTTFAGVSAALSIQLNGAGMGSSNQLLETGGGALNLGNQTALNLSQTTPTSVGQSFTIVSGASSITGTFYGLANGASFTNGGRTYRINYTTSAVTLTDVTPVNLHWIGASGANGNEWSVASNWLEDTVPVSGDTLIFDTTTAGFSASANGFAPVNNITGLTGMSIVIKDASSAGDFDLTGDAVSVASAGISSTVSAGVNATEAMPLILPAAATVTVNAGMPLVLSSATSGTGALTKAGAGTLTLSGASGSYTGATDLTAGALLVNANYGGSPVSVTAGTLAGTGTVQSINATGGVVNPAGAGVAGTLSTAAGTFASALNGANLQMDLNTPSSSDKLVVGSGGTINLAGATLNVNLLGSASSSPYTLVSSSSGGITGTFTGLPNNAILTSGSQAFGINYSATAVTLTATEIVFTTTSPTVTVNQASGVLTIQLQTSSGTTVPAPSSGLTLTLSSSSNGATFLSTNGTPLTGNKLTIASGVSTASFKYEDSKAGTPTITASATGFASAQLSATVVPLLTSSTASLPQNAVTMTLSGQGFDTIATNDHVTFSNGVTGTVTAATATKLTVGSLTGLSLGTLNASISIDGVSSGAAVQVATVTAAQFGTSTSVSPSPSPGVLGQSITFTATVTGTATGVGVPTGSVTFTEGATTLAANVPLNANGQAAFNTSTLSLGSHTITASFTGTNSWQNSSGSGSEAVRYGTTTSPVSPASTNANPSTYGQSLTFTATVASTSGLGGVPSGSVTFFNGTTSLGTRALVAGTATLTLTTPSVGAYAIVATYLGAGNFAGSSSLVAYSQTVNRIVPNTSVVKAASSNPPHPTYGQSLTFTATVTNPANVGGVPTGSVTFYNGTSSLGTRALVSGTATLTLATLPAGTDSLTAKYLGAGNFASSSSPSALPQTVSKISTTTSVVKAASGNPANPVYGQSLTFTATVTNTSGVGGVPTGVVTFYNGTTALGTRTLVNGTATLTLTNLPGGTSLITASYLGATNFATSSSPSALSQTVAPASTGTNVVGSPNPATAGQLVTLTATVTNTAGTGATPAGTVTFKDVFKGVTTILGTRSLVNGVATFTTTALATGSHDITAYFNLNDDFLASANSVFQVIM